MRDYHASGLDIASRSGSAFMLRASVEHDSVGVTAVKWWSSARGSSSGHMQPHCFNSVLQARKSIFAAGAFLKATGWVCLPHKPREVSNLVWIKSGFASTQAVEPSCITSKLRLEAGGAVSPGSP